MRYAIVSDIHANRQAWEATLNDIPKWNVDATLCLGDIVGYGPMPEPVLESVREYVDDIVIGNHDAVMGGRSSSDLFGAHALQSLEWTRSRLDDASIRFLGDLPSLIEGDGFALAHAEVLDPEMFGYIENPTDARLNFESNAYPLIFVGHTHYPEIYALDTVSHAVQRVPPQDFVMADEHRYLVNVGSIGDPRDGTDKASYCIFDDVARSIVFRKLPFDLDSYKADMTDRKSVYKPYFIMAAAHPGARPSTRDWAMEMPPRSQDATKQPVKITHVSQSSGGMKARREAARKRADILLGKAEQERQERERRLQRRKLELARAAEERRKMREAKRAAETAAIREKLQYKKTLATRITQAGRTKEPAPPTAAASASLRETREIVIKKDTPEKNG